MSRSPSPRARRSDQDAHGSGLLMAALGSARGAPAPWRWPCSGGRRPAIRALLRAGAPARRRPLRLAGGRHEFGLATAVLVVVGFTGICASMAGAGAMRPSQLRPCPTSCAAASSSLHMIVFAGMAPFGAFMVGEPFARALRHPHDPRRRRHPPRVPLSHHTGPLVARLRRRTKSKVPSPLEVKVPAPSEVPAPKWKCQRRASVVTDISRC